MQAESIKLINMEDEKGKGSPSEELTSKIMLAKEDVYNPLVEYNIAVLYSYTKNFAFAIDGAVRLLVSLDFNKDSFLYLKTAFFLLVCPPFY